jgi:hypothetical protein
MREIFFTFDVEDFTNERSFIALHAIIELLNKYDFIGIFFITGYVAEKLENYPKIVDLLEEHEIGYHSSGHSVHPTIFEFTDVKSYKKAYEISLVRETSHINPLNGQIEGKGGIFNLQKLFPSKKILSYRAPGHCWSPPYTEALRDLGIKFDFSSNLSRKPIQHKGLTFYPYDIIAQWDNKIYDHYLFWLTFTRSDHIVIGLHPSLFFTYDGWDSIYHKGNPVQISPPKPRKISETKILLRSFDLFLKQIKSLEKLKLAKVISQPVMSKETMNFTIEIIEKSYARSMRWARNVFGYTPRYLKDHFYTFFNHHLPHSHE